MIWKKRSLNTSPNLVIGNKRILSLITARGGSKGLPGKNLLPLGDMPLLAWTIQASRKSQYVDRTILSSDSPEIMTCAKKYGCEVLFKRPDELATDSATSFDVIHHAMNFIGEDQFDYLVLLQPTSPFRSAADIDACLQLCVRNQAPAAVSVNEVRKAPQWMFSRETSGRMKPVLGVQNRISRRQDLPVTVELNGAIFIGDWKWLRGHDSFIADETLSYVMPSERSIDIDSRLDYDLARVFLDGNRVDEEGKR